MGSASQQRSELAAFFGNALHESDEFRAGREYLMCADRIEMGGEVYCRPCDAGSFDWDTMTCPPGASLASQGRAFNSYCQSNLLPPEGCKCDDVYERSPNGPMAGYVKANQVYFGRGSIQLSWNYNYIRASVALTGASQTFCQRPDLVATNGEYAWGAGLFYWMENVKNDKTCHQSVLLNGEFGETLDNINGGLECPADDHGWHGKAVVLRLNRYCRAASALDVGNLLSLEGCMDMERRMRQCLKEGTCRDCKVWEDELMFLDGAKEEVEAAKEDTGSSGGGGGGKKKDKDKDKNKQDDNAASGSKGAKEKKNKDKIKQEAADAASIKQEAADTGDTTEDTIMSETPKPTQPPTPQPTHQPTTPIPTYTPTQSPQESLLCTDLPCPVPDNIPEQFEFCRSSDGVCGMGPHYCNSQSTWTKSCLTAIMPDTMPSPPTTSPNVVITTTSKDDAVTSTSTASVETPASVSRPQSSLRTRRPTRAPTPKPTMNPTSIPTRAYSSAASQFGSIPAPVTKPAAVVSQRQPDDAVASPPSSTSSHASQFAMMTHSKGKGRYNPVSASATTTVTRPKPDTASPPTDSPTDSPNKEEISHASQFGGMTNWANTKLEYPPSDSPIGVVVAPPSPATAILPDSIIDAPASLPPTHLPTRLPTKKPVKVINIAEAFPNPSSNEVEDESEELVDYSSEIVETRSENESEEELPDTDTPPAPLPAAVSLEESSASQKEEVTATTSYYTKLDDDSFLFSPMDDVTISRSYPSTNFGSEPAIVVDMLEGDATLLRFDLSVVGNGAIQKATLRLTTARNDEEDGVSNAAGVYYIQPTVNGWTEDSVTYDTAPKADGPLFASVASLSSEDFENNSFFELDLTEAVANHVISFRVIGTDRVRKEFRSKESYQVDNAPVLLVKLESTKAEETASETTTVLLPPKQGSSMGKDKATVVKVTGGSEEESPPSSSSSSSGRISGHIWLDRNNDGIKDTNEPGLRGILVDLYQCNDDDDNKWLEGTRTAAGGDYIFEDLEVLVVEGSRYYVVVTTASSDYGFTKKGAVAGAEEHVKVSDVDPTTGRGDCIELSSSSTSGKKLLSASVNAGIVKMSTPHQISSTETIEIPTIPDSDPVVVAPESEDENNDSSNNYNCRGKPCTEEGGDGDDYCRSKYNFCGIGEVYCNEDSQWTAACGTPLPTYRPSSGPTTGRPTFLHDPDVHCAGEPCDDDEGGDGSRTWCRSEIGYCGSGPLYCNVDSTWMPDCDEDDVATDDASSVPTTKSPSVPSSTTTGVPSLEKGQPTNSPTLFPTKDDTMFSSFALPTLSQIVTPKQTDIDAATKGHSKSTTKDEDEEASSFQTDASSSPTVTESSTPESEGQKIITKKPMRSNDAEDKPWYVRFADVEPVSRNVGSRSILGSVSILFSAIITFLL